MNALETPYSSPVADPDEAMIVIAPKSYGKRMFVGFAIGAAISLAVGSYTVLPSQVHVESNVTGGFVSGGVSVAALFLVFIVSPLLGIVGAIASRFLPPSRET